jgi:SAM-dependent methyltransferase
VPGSSWTSGAGHFDTVAASYEALRPELPEDVFTEIQAVARLTADSRVVEVGAGTGQATVRLASLGSSVVALEPGPALAQLAAQRFAAFPKVEVIQASFEDWEPGDRRFDVLVAANCWHWVDPAVRWRKAHDVLAPEGWLVILSHLVVREPGEPEVYAETADLHEAYAPGHPDWGHPPTAEEVMAAAEAPSNDIVELERTIGRAPDASSATALFEVPLLRWFREDQHFDAHGYVELMRTTSLYGGLEASVREGLLTAMEQRIRERMGDHATRRYLLLVRLARRSR